MNRLQKKCLVASGITHGILFIVLIIGSAFLPNKPKEEAPRFEMFRLPKDFKLVDEMIVGGGNPNASPPKQEPVVQPTPPPKPPPEPQKEQKLEAPKPEKTPAPQAEEKPNTRIKVDTKPKKIEVNLKPVTKVDDDKPEKPNRARDLKKEAKEAKEAKEREQKVATLLKEEIDRVGKTISEKSSRSTDVDVLGPGGSAYINYAFYVKEIYHEAWRTPSETMTDVSDVEVEVTIARDGRVVSSSIRKKSGNSALDKSVQEALNRVRKVREFPEGAKDDQRTFRITYSLLATRKLG
jgi:colicin import membrane protein